MPMYSFKCDNKECRHASTEYAQMKDSVPIGDCMLCPKCGYVLYRRLVDLPHTDMREFHTPIQMLSVACNSLDEIRDIQRRCPGVQISDDPKDDLYGVPIAATRQQKRAVLKASGFTEHN